MRRENHLCLTPVKRATICAWLILQGPTTSLGFAVQVFKKKKKQLVSWRIDGSGGEWMYFERQSPKKKEKEGKTQQKDEVRLNSEPCEKNGLTHTKRRFRKVKETRDKLESGVGGEQQREREAVSGACVLGNVIGRRGSQEE